MEVTETLLVSNLHPTLTIEITDRLRLMPLSEAPPSPIRDSHLDAKPQKMPAVVPQIRAAVVRRTGYEVSPGQEFEIPKTPERYEASNAMLDIPRALTIALRKPILPVAMGFTAPPGVTLPGSSGYGGWWQNALKIGPAEPKPQEIDEERVRSLVTGLAALSKDLKPSLRIAIDRLALVPTHPWYHERAMDLGIALEAVLFAGDKSDYHGEIKYRFKVRGTLLASMPTKAERIATARLLGKFYDVRSRVAHGGRSPHNNEKEEATIDQCMELCFDLIEKFIRLGRPIDWDGIVMGW